MKILVASDKFKGSLTAKEACEAIQTGLELGSVETGNQIRTLPLADGGEGLATTLTEAEEGIWKTKSVRDALGNPIEAGYGISRDGSTAFLEMAEASGLAQLDQDSLDPWKASTYGTGELLRDALDGGAREIILGIGGSATNDGGAGMAAALGFRFLNSSGQEITELPERLKEVVQFEPPSSLPSFGFTIACDVKNLLLGETGCTRIYGPQKGIVPPDFFRHEDRLLHLVRLLGEEGRLAALEPGSGAAGGLGFGCRVFFEGELKSGSSLVSQALALPSAVEWADLVVTGEGKIDLQSLEGKAPFGIAEMARKNQKKVIAFCGVSDAEPSSQELILNAFDEVVEIRNASLSLTENLQRGRDHLIQKAKDIAESIST